MTILGVNIKKLRETAGMSITDLNKLSGIGRSTISEIESGKAKDSKGSTINALAKAFGVSSGSLTEMEFEHEYVISDIEEAMELILNQENLMLRGETLNDEAKIQLSNSIKMALQFAVEAQKRNNKLI